MDCGVAAPLWMSASGPVGESGGGNTPGRLGQSKAALPRRSPKCGGLQAATRAGRLSVAAPEFANAKILPDYLRHPVIRGLKFHVGDLWKSG